MQELYNLLAAGSTYTDGDLVREAHAEYEALNNSLPELYAEWERSGRGRRGDQRPVVERSRTRG